MRSARPGRPRTFGVVLALVLPIVGAKEARADEAPAPVHVVVRTVEPIDDALFERTVGQVSDLPVALEAVPDAALEPSTSARIERARSLSLALDAPIVVWFEHPTGSAPLVWIALPSRERVLVRRAAGESDPMASSSSAILEASSLVVRTALVAFASGVELGVPNEEVLREERSPPPPRPRPPPSGAPRPPPSAPERWAPFATLGWQLTLDGRSPAGARAGTLEAGLGRGPWFASLRGSLGLPSRSHDDVVALETTRHSGAALVGRTLVRGGAWQLALAGGPMIVGLRRLAAPRDAGFVPSPPATRATAAATLELRATWTPAPRFPVLLGVGVGADALASAPSFSYETTRGVVEQPSWLIEPRLAFFALLRP